MSSNFYTNSYLENHDRLEAERNEAKQKINEIQTLLPAMLEELKQVVYRLDSIEKAMSK
ncbi:hypothetical protein R9X47_24195 [Wukongibacter baidiensis]|uniref:hypothetical protein n=1 Tax=Wukongibacter baidiensis TaxID=1723361 RepID=UPI003D7FA805